MKSPLMSIAECAEIIGVTEEYMARKIRDLKAAYPDLVLANRGRRVHVKRAEFYKAVGLTPESNRTPLQGSSVRIIEKLVRDVRRAVLRIQQLERKMMHLETKGGR